MAAQGVLRPRVQAELGALLIRADLISHRAAKTVCTTTQIRPLQALDSEFDHQEE